MIKVLFVIDTLASGGAQRQLIHLINGLEKLGHRPDILTYFDKSRDENKFFIVKLCKN